MSDHDEPSTFSVSGDAREEAVWAAYQAMLRRRRDTRPRWSAADESPDDARSETPATPPERPQPVGAARTIPPRPREAQAAEPGPLVFRPIAADAPFASSGRATGEALVKRRRGAGGGVAAGVAALLMIGSALAVAIWLHGLTPPGRTAAHGTLGRAAGAQTDVVPAPGPTPPDIASDASGTVAPAPGATPRHITLAERASPKPTARTAAATAPVSPALKDLRAETPTPAAAPRNASVETVRAFYDALGAGNGEQAAALVVPERRAAGPLWAAAITEFHSALKAPLHVTKIDPIDDDTVFVNYEFVNPANHICLGTATVDTIHRDGATLVQRIQADNDC